MATQKKGFGTMIANAVPDTSAHEHRIGMWIIQTILWLVLGVGTSIIYGALSFFFIVLWTQETDPVRVLQITQAFDTATFIYVIIQGISGLVAVLKEGGKVVRGMADMGLSSLPMIGVLIAGTMIFFKILIPTELTWYVIRIICLAVFADFLFSGYFFRASQKTLDVGQATSN